MSAGDDPAQVLVTGLSADDERLLVIPREWCIASVRMHSALQNATTFGEVRKDKGAASVVEDGIDDYIRRLYENGEIDEDVDEGKARRKLTRASAPFDAYSFFADEDQNWRPDAAHDTEHWFEGNEPELFELCSQADSGWGISYTPSRLVPAEQREAVERLLLRLGYRILQLEDLHDLYLNPPEHLKDVASRVRQAKRPTYRAGRRAHRRGRCVGDHRPSES